MNRISMDMNMTNNKVTNLTLTLSGNLFGPYNNNNQRKKQTQKQNKQTKNKKQKQKTKQNKTK